MLVNIAANNTPMKIPLKIALNVCLRFIDIFERASERLYSTRLFCARSAGVVK